jgi:hypothetical protein
MRKNILKKKTESQPCFSVLSVSLINLAGYSSFTVFLFILVFYLIQIGAAIKSTRFRINLLDRSKFNSLDVIESKTWKVPNILIDFFHSRLSGFLHILYFSQ